MNWNCWLVASVRVYWRRLPPSAVDHSHMSIALPLLWLTMTYQALVSIVAADAVVSVVTATPATRATAAPMMSGRRHRRLRTGGATADAVMNGPPWRGQGVVPAQCLASPPYRPRKALSAT